jgi:hypothetical protein
MHANRSSSKVPTSTTETLNELAQYRRSSHLPPCDICGLPSRLANGDERVKQDQMVLLGLGFSYISYLISIYFPTFSYHLSFPFGSVWFDLRFGVEPAALCFVNLNKVTTTLMTNEGFGPKHPIKGVLCRGTPRG